MFPFTNRATHFGVTLFLTTTAVLPEAASRAGSLRFSAFLREVVGLATAAPRRERQCGRPGHVRRQQPGGRSPGKPGFLRRANALHEARCFNGGLNPGYVWHQIVQGCTNFGVGCFLPLGLAVGEPALG